MPAQLARYLEGWGSSLAWESGPGTRTWLMSGPDGSGVT
jgi:hypothetical protein